MNKLTIDDLKVKGKKVLLRVDFNVPLDENQKILDDTRIRSALPTIEALCKRGAKLVLVSHLGRPKGKPDEKLSLKTVAQALETLLNRHISFSPAIIGPVATTAIDCLNEGDCLMMENIRFYPEETQNDPQFSKELASMVDLYVNDAFGTAHRAHASTVGVAKYFENAACGYLMKKELEFLATLLKSPVLPYYAILGGAKVKDKIKLIHKLIEKADKILVGGGMAYTFMKSKGLSIGKSLLSEEELPLVRDTLAYAEKLGKEILLPVDHIIAKEISDESSFMAVDNEIPEGYYGLDIGPKTVEIYQKVIKEARTIFWNGPMGVFEMKNFQRGTFEIAEEMARSLAVTVVGGGDSVEAVNLIGKANEMSHISTGGGASLEFLEGHELPGIAALAEKK